MGRVKTDFRDAQKKIAKFKKQASKELQKSAKKEVIGSIERGVSPVIKQGRFKKYSQSYRDDIRAGRYRRFKKRERPVNLKLSGKLLKSFFSKVSKTGIIVGFDNFLAEIHNNKGAGKSKTIRRILPTEPGETFNRSITMKFREVLNGVASKIFKR